MTEEELAQIIAEGEGPYLEFTTVHFFGGSEISWYDGFQPKREESVMSDKRRRFRTIRDNLKKLYPFEPKGNLEPIPKMGTGKQR